MWLLSIEKWTLESFEGRRLPSYAILSHRWTDDEVSFQDVQAGMAKRRKGYLKIDHFCNQVSRSGLPIAYVWIDTCCIDKSNNSELSEAINSMYKWYRQAEVCYAYLSDVSEGNLSEFAQSVWFTRGWTLQELLAPRDVEFFDQDWGCLGSKLQLNEVITSITGIPADALEYFDHRRTPYSVADRMSWAAARQTTREEDLAHSLLGVFGVNMPLLYGEGPRAFLRLQEEILKISEDLTLFAWSRFPKLSASNDYFRDNSTHDFGVFAASPDSFSHRGQKFHNLLDTLQINDGNLLEPYLSGAGLSINLILVPHCPTIYIAPICYVVESGQEKFVAMFLEQAKSKGRYHRIVYNAQSVIIDYPRVLNLSAGRTQKVVLERTPYHVMAKPLRARYGFNIFHIENDILRLFQVTGRHNVDILRRDRSQNFLFMESGDIGVAGILRFNRRGISPIYFHFGFDFNFNPFCLISRPLHRDSQTNEYKIVFETSVKHIIPVECSMSILRLVGLIRADSRKCNLQQHNLELHLGSFKSHEMQFVGRDCRIGLDLSAGHVEGYVYHVSIGLADKQYTWASNQTTEQWSNESIQRVKWYADGWDPG